VGWFAHASRGGPTRGGCAAAKEGDGRAAGMQWCRPGIAYWMGVRYGAGRNEYALQRKDGIRMRGARRESAKFATGAVQGSKQACMALATTWWYRAPTGGGPQRATKSREKSTAAGQAARRMGGRWAGCGAVCQHWSNAGRPGTMERVQQRKRRRGRRVGGRAVRNGAGSRGMGCCGAKGWMVRYGGVGEGVGSGKRGRHSRNEAVWRDPGRQGRGLGGRGLPPGTNRREGGRGRMHFR
jgi:hypothetical protein